MYSFKVCDRNSGLYLAAGGNWTKGGKTWQQLSHLKSALSDYRERKEIPPNWELIVMAPIGGMNLDVIFNANLKERDVIKSVEKKDED